MNALPSLRRKIFRSLSIMVLIYAGFGVFLMLGVMLSRNTSPKIIHVNYDSIAASERMPQAWHALTNPKSFPQHTPLQWTDQFETALTFEEGNLTEPGEKEAVKTLRERWNQAKGRFSGLPNGELGDVEALISRVVSLNEAGMFGLAQENDSLSRKVLIGGALYFLLTLILGFLLADGLATRLSRPLKSIAEALHRRPAIGRRLKLIEPNTLELLILNTELSKLWERVTETEKVNVSDLLAQKTKLETVLGSVEDGLLVVDMVGRVSHSNECVLQLIDLPIEQVRGQLWRDLPCTNPNYMKMRMVLQESMNEASEIELNLLSANHQFAARSRKILGSDGQPVSILYLLHDITEKRQRDRFRAEFIDLLSHELKTPLQSLGTASELLESHKPQMPEVVHPLIETIREDVERIRAVANEFVQVTQSHSKVLKIKLELVALNERIQEWLKPFRIVAKDRSVTLDFVQEGSQVMWSSLDTVKFPWVISNLLSNAIRFSPVGGVVQVLLTDRNGALEIKVMDEGPGVASDDQMRMFEPFFQSPTLKTTSGKQGLFGIGLTIAREVVEAHDGRIEYYSRQPHGSEFRIVLPFPTGQYN